MNRASKSHEESTLGLLDFAKDVGRQLFNTDSEPADNIKQHLEIKLSGIRNLDVK